MFDETPQDNYSALCPSCEQNTDFDYVGQQHWPERVARALGSPRVFGLWTCRNCGSTVSGFRLKPPAQECHNCD